MKLKAILIGITLLPNLLFAQFIGKIVESNVCSGPKSNYVFLFDNKILAETKKLPDWYQEGAECAIMRSENGGEYIEIDRVKPVDSRKALNDLYGKPTFIEEFMKASEKKFNSQDEVVALFKNPNNKFESLYLEPILLFKALGLLYEDKAVIKGRNYQYKVVKIDKSGNRQQLTEGAIRHGIGNSLLSEVAFKGLRYATFALDSMVSMSWISAQNKYRSVYSINIYGSKNGRDKFKLVDSKRINYTNDSLLAVIYQPSLMGEVWRFYIKPIDYLGNEGKSSDTLTVASIPKNKLPIIHGFTSRDTVDGVHLSWKPLPAQPFITGIILNRSETDDKTRFVTLDTLQANETEFFDRSVENGKTYNYEIMPHYGLLNNITADDIIPSQVAGVHGARDRVFPPKGLKVSNLGKFVQVDWEKSEDKLVNQYAVYSGDDINNLTQVSAFINENTFLDTTQHGDFAFRTRYYAVSAITYNGKISANSNAVSIRPRQPNKIAAPIQVTLQQKGNQVFVEWIDMASREKLFEGYRVFRRSNENASFELLTKEMLYLNRFTDTTIVEDGFYEYAVMSIGKFGEVSPLSIPNKIVFEASKAETMPIYNEFSLRNIPPAIEINWVEYSLPNLKNYVIYRKTVDEGEFLKIATLPNDKTRYWDKEAKIGETYLYAISYTLNDGSESPKSDVKLVKREEIKEE
jgi:fibronectin type 3 domain-containing protein